MIDFLNLDSLAGISPAIVFYIALAVLVLILVVAGVKTVPEGRAKLVERLGRRHRTLYPGINFIIPIFDRVRKIERNRVLTKVGGRSISLIDESGALILAEQRMDPPSKILLARDNSQINVDPIVYFKPRDPARLIYDVTDFQSAFETLIETTLRQEVGKYDGDTIVTSRDSLNDALKSNLKTAAESLGIEITRVEIEDLSFDAEVTRSLSDARQEELKRRAELVAEKAAAEQLTLKAEASRKAAILEAEGVKEALVLEAQGKFEAQKLEAEAKFLMQSREQEGLAQGFAAIARALQENPEAIVALEALKAQAKIAESIGNSNNALIIPSETAGLFGAIGSLTKGIDIVKDATASNRSADPKP